jgi:hypothetical protein
VLGSIPSGTTKNPSESMIMQGFFYESVKASLLIVKICVLVEKKVVLFLNKNNFANTVLMI